jgi:hypothetical protein
MLAWVRHSNPIGMTRGRFKIGLADLAHNLTLNGTTQFGTIARRKSCGGLWR